MMQKQNPAIYQLETQLKPGSNTAEIFKPGPPSPMMMMIDRPVLFLMILTILMIMMVTLPGSPC